MNARQRRARNRKQLPAPVRRAIQEWHRPEIDAALERFEEWKRGPIGAFLGLCDKVEVTYVVPVGFKTDG